MDLLILVRFQTVRALIQILAVAFLLTSISDVTSAAEAVTGTAKPGRTINASFKKIVLSQQYFCDGINHGDINQDGSTDVVAGPYWYAGPSYRERHAFYPPILLDPRKSPSNSMFSFVYDFNADGWPDILTLGRVHLHPAYWYENPGSTGGTWHRHYAFERVQGESPTLVDLDNDGHPQVVCHWQGQWGWIEPDWNTPTQPWRFYPVSFSGKWKEFYHGTGAGDIDGDGRQDLVINDGWFQQPANGRSVWTWHPNKFSLGRGGAQMFVYDIDGDGDADVISSLDAHGWGLAWFEQYDNSGTIAFRMHQIMGTRQELEQYGVAFSQPHALDFADINGDGLKDLVVGKRKWAHGPKGDVEPEADPVLYWFELVRINNSARFVPHQIDNRSGVGVQVTIADLNNDGANDILTASKLGSFIFLSNSNLFKPRE
ncbi:MAG: VCBS repeat-containing protein [Pirellulales bacterium]